MSSRVITRGRHIKGLEPSTLAKKRRAKVDEAVRLAQARRYRLWPVTGLEMLRLMDYQGRVYPQFVQAVRQAWLDIDARYERA